MRANVSGGPPNGTPPLLAVPQAVVAVLAPGEDAGRQVLELALIQLFREEQVSSGYAADVLDMSQWEFIQLLGRHGVPYVDLSPEEVRQDFQNASTFSRHRPLPANTSSSSPTPAP